MNKIQIKAIGLLNGCVFQPASYPKRFVRDLASVVDKERCELSEKQKRYLWKLVYSYRKQHDNKWFAVHAKNLLEKWKTEETEKQSQCQIMN